MASLLSFGVCLLLWAPASLAISPAALGESLPDALVIDDADVFSRASRGELKRNYAALKINGSMPA